MVEEALAAVYTACIALDVSLDVHVLPPFAVAQYEPRTDLHDIHSLISLLPRAFVIFSHPHTVCALAKGSRCKDHRAVDIDCLAALF